MTAPPPVQIDRSRHYVALDSPRPAVPALRARRPLPRPTTRAQSALLAAITAALTCAAVSLPLWAPAISVTDLIATLASSPAAFAAAPPPAARVPPPALDLAALPPPAAGPAQEETRKPAAVSASALSAMETALDLAFLLAVACTFLTQRQPLGVKLVLAAVSSVALFSIMALLHWGLPAAKALARLCA